MTDMAEKEEHKHTKRRQSERAVIRYTTRDPCRAAGCLFLSVVHIVIWTAMARLSTGRPRRAAISVTARSPASAYTSDAVVWLGLAFPSDAGRQHRNRRYR